MTSYIALNSFIGLLTNIDSLSSLITAIISIILAWLTYWNIHAYRKDKRIDEDKALIIKPLENMLLCIEYLCGFKRTKEIEYYITKDIKTMENVLIYRNTTEKKDLNKDLIIKDIQESSLFMSHLKLDNYTIEDFINSYDEQSLKDNISRIISKRNKFLDIIELENIKIQEIQKEIIIKSFLLPQRFRDLFNKIQKDYISMHDIDENYELNKTHTTYKGLLSPQDYDLIIAEIQQNLEYVYTKKNFFRTSFIWQELEK